MKKITDDGLKKSAKGLLCVVKDENDEYVLMDEVGKDTEKLGSLLPVFENGKLLIDWKLSEIRERIKQ